MTKRIIDYFTNFVLNGTLGLIIFFVCKFAFLYFSPTSWYFQYSSVEPVNVPVEISSDYILMESTLQNFQQGNMAWNDVLRCRDEDTGVFAYVGQDNTESATVIINPEVVLSRWEYNGNMPRVESLCRIDSTITRNLAFGIEKKQYVRSSLFKIE